MAYGIKYRFSFYDQDDENQYRLEILEDGFLGNITTLASMGEDPVVIAVQGSDDFLQTVIGSEVIMQFVSEASLQWKEFAEAYNRQYQVKVYKEDTGWYLKWIGYIDPGQYKEHFLPGNQIIEVRATDGLGDLKNEPYGTAWDIPYTGQDDLMAEIAVILGKLDFGIDIWSFNNLFSSTHNTTDTDDPLPQTYFNKERFQETIIKSGNCYAALEGLLNWAGLAIKQDEGVWKLIPIRWVRQHNFDELLLNGGFTAWTADNPDNWTLGFSEDSNNYVNEGVDGNEAEFVTDGSPDPPNPTTFYQDILTIGKIYTCVVQIKEITSGSISFGTLVAGQYDSFTTPGEKSFTFTPTVARFYIYSTNCNGIIVNVSVKQKSIDYRVFNSSGVYQSNSTIIFTKEITVPTATNPIAWVDSSQMILIQRGWKEFTILKDLGNRKNVIQNPEFLDKMWTDANTPMKWTLSDDSDPSWVQNAVDRAYMDTFGSTIGLCRDLSQQPLLHKLEIFSYIKFKVTFNIEVAGSGTDAIYIMIKLDTGALQRYLTRSSGVPQWSSSVSYLTALLSDSVRPTVIEIESGFTPIGPADLYVYIYEVVGGSAQAEVWWDKIELELVKYGGLGYPPTTELLTVVDASDVKISEQIKVSLAQITGSINEESVYEGGLLDSSGDALGDWNHKGVSDVDDAIDHLASDILTFRNGPSYKLSGKLRTNQITFVSVLQTVVGGVDKYFITNRMRRNLKKKTWQGDWSEIRHYVHCEQYQTVYDSLTTPPSDAIARAQNKLVETLVKAEAWNSVLDGFIMLAQTTNGGNEATKNWISPGLFDATLVNSPTFTALEGVAGNGSTSYIDLNYNPYSNAVNRAANSACMGFYNRVHDAGYEMGNQTDSIAAQIGTDMWLRIQSGTNVNFVNNVVEGMIILTRDNALSIRSYRNKTERTDTLAYQSSGDNGNYYALARQLSGSPSNHVAAQLSVIFYGANLTKEKAEIITDAFEEYMVSNGKGVI